MQQTGFLGVWARQGIGVVLGWPKTALLMVELRVTRKREIQGQNKNGMPGTLLCGKSQAVAESQSIPGSRMKPN